VPAESQRLFVLNPRRACWTPWLVLGGVGGFDLKERGGIVLVQVVFKDGTIGEPFEDGPTKSGNLGNKPVQKIRFKSLGREPVTIMFSVQ